MWETTVFPGEERRAVSLGGDCLTSSGRKTTSHDKKMFFKTWREGAGFIYFECLFQSGQCSV